MGLTAGTVIMLEGGTFIVPVQGGEEMLVGLWSIHAEPLYNACMFVCLYACIVSLLGFSLIGCCVAPNLRLVRQLKLIRVL